MKLPGLLSAGKSAGNGLKRTLLIFLVAVIFCSGLPAQPAVSQPSVSEDAVEISGDGLTQREALERVRANFPGNIISINAVNQEGRIRFRIRIDNEGNIYTVYVDQATGVVTRE